MKLNKIILIILLITIILFLQICETFDQRLAPQGESGEPGPPGAAATSNLTRERISTINNFLNNLRIENGVFKINNQSAEFLMNRLWHGNKIFCGNKTWVQLKTFS